MFHCPFQSFLQLLVLRQSYYEKCFVTTAWTQTVYTVSIDTIDNIDTICLYCVYRHYRQHRHNLFMLSIVSIDTVQTVCVCGAYSVYAVYEALIEVLYCLWCLQCLQTQYRQFCDEEKAYIQDIIEKGELKCTVISPPCPALDQPPRLYLQRPRLLLLDPLTHYEHVVSNLCHQHGDELALGRWHDGSRNSLTPRCLLDIGGPLLLIGRSCYCSTGRHYVRSTDNNIIDRIKTLAALPFRLSVHYGYTTTFIEELRRLISLGTSFKRFELSYIERVASRLYSFERDYWNHLRRYKMIKSSSEHLDNFRDHVK